MPTNGPRNFPVDAEFARKICESRIQRGLTQTELAEEAGLTPRTVRDLEAGRKKAIQVKTVMLLAKALKVEPAILLDQSDSRDAEKSTNRGRFRSKRTLAASLIIVIVLGAGGVIWAWHEAKACGSWTLNEGVLEVRDSMLGRVLWRLDMEVPNCMDSPWSQDHLIVGVSSKYAAKDCVLCLDRATGDTIWAAGPDFDAIGRAFGSDIIGGVSFSCTSINIADLQGDGEPEIVALCVHGLNYPTAILVIDRDGRVESQYTNKGHLFDDFVLDLDGDGRDEIVAVGVNNDVAYSGATIIILDDHHRHGASVDHFANPESIEIDGSLARALIPPFPKPYMDVLKISRIAARSIRPNWLPNGGADIMIQLGHHSEQPTYNATFDSDLQLVDIVLLDGFVQAVMVDWPDSLKLDTGPADEVWRDEWLSGMVVYRARDWTPVVTD